MDSATHNCLPNQHLSISQTLSAWQHTKFVVEGTTSLDSLIIFSLLGRMDVKTVLYSKSDCVTYDMHRRHHAQPYILRDRPKISTFSFTNITVVGRLTVNVCQLNVFTCRVCKGIRKGGCKIILIYFTSYK